MSLGGRFILTGGAARSRSYRQVLADMTEEEIWVCPVAETAAAGACVQAAASFFDVDVAEMSARWAFSLEIAATPSRTRDASLRPRYEEISQQFRRNYYASN